ncbi:tetratricopeptide repeat protein [Photobacterium sp. DNB23_23_1]
MKYLITAAGAMVLFVLSGCSSLMKSEGEVLYEQYRQERNPQQKHVLLKQSSDAGYPMGQIEYAEYIFKETFDLALHQEAIEIGNALYGPEYPRAMRMLDANKTYLSQKGKALNGDKPMATELCRRYLSSRDKLSEIACDHAIDIGADVNMQAYGTYLYTRGGKRDKGFKILTKSAEAGDAGSQYELYNITRRSEGFLANKWLTKSAENDYADAQYQLGMNLVKGRGATYPEGVEWLEKAAANDHRKAAEYLRENALYIKLRPKIQANDPAALYEYGKHTVRASNNYSPAGGVKHIKKAAGLGHQPAKAFLAEHHQEISYDTILSGSDSGAQIDLGIQYYHGRGVSKNVNKAEALFKKASKDGNSIASRNLAILYEKRGQFSSAVDHYQKAGRQGDADSYNDAAAMVYEIKHNSFGYNGASRDIRQYVDRNGDRWVDWLRQGARSGSQKAAANLNLWANYLNTACSSFTCSMTVPTPTFYR